MKQPLVVGYKGEIGSFILNGLLRIMPKALNIWCVDVNETKEEVEERIKKSDVIFLFVPIKKTISWLVINNEKDLLKGKVIIEQASLKEWIYDEIKKDEESKIAAFYTDLSALKDIDIRSMHILFRPSVTPNLSDRRVGLFKGQFTTALNSLNQVPGIILPSDIAEITQSTIVWYDDAEAHDREMAVQQALLHRTLLTLGDMISKCNGRTYISQKVIELCDRIKSGNKELYSLIQQNKHVPNVLKGLTENIDHFYIDKLWP